MKRFLKKIANSVSESSLASRLRKKRFKLFLDMVSSKGVPSTILDVGGWERYWEIQDFIKTDNTIILLNLNKVETHYPNVSSIAGDARDLSRFADQSIDIVFSNSVIEHLFTFEDQQKMANEVQRVGKNYYVQTPSYWFPLEPHFLFPFFHWLPISLRVFLVMHFSLGWFKKADSRAEAMELVNEIKLLTCSEMKKLFPEAIIYKEKLFGITKSFIAISK